MTLCAVSAIGRDRPGIVAAVTAELLELGGNIEDSRMTILRGHFTMTLIVSLPDQGAAAELDRRLADVREKLGLEALTVTPADDLAGTAPEATHIISLYGADHPGIVHAAASALAERDISITDLETKLAGAPDAPLYVMLIEIAAGGIDSGELEQAMTAVGKASGLEVSVRELDRTAL